jgi:hypothetical protein
MRLQRFTNFLLQHRIVAFVLTFLVSFVPLIGTVGIVYAAFVTLCRGIVEGAIFTFAATIPYAIMLMIPSFHEGKSDLVLWLGISFAVLSNLLTWIFAILLRRQNSWSQMIQVAALIGVLVVSVIHLAYPDISSWWGTQLNEYYTKAMAVTNNIQGSTPANATTVAGDQINASKQYATGVLIAGLLLSAFLQLIAARWWQSAMFYPRILRRELHGIRLSVLAGVLFILSLVLASMDNPVVLDMMPIVYLLFAAAGLSLIHWVLAMNPNSVSWFGLLFIYFALIFPVLTSNLAFVSSITVLMVAVLALADAGFNIRKRLRKF